jgi:hypothetical protein
MQFLKIDTVLLLIREMCDTFILSWYDADFRNSELYTIYWMSEVVT